MLSCHYLILTMFDLKICFLLQHILFSLLLISYYCNLKFVVYAANVTLF